MQAPPDETLFIQQAIQLAQEALQKGGGPFGAIVVQGEAVVGRGFNRVTVNNDPTAHAEIEAIRDACKNLGQFHLQDCVLYTSCQPCPMCLSATYWAKLEKVYYAASAEDAAAAGFQDAFLYREFALPEEQRSLQTIHLHCENANQVFTQWQQMDNKTPY